MPPQVPTQLAINSSTSDPRSRLDLTWTDTSETESGFHPLKAVLQVTAIDGVAPRGGKLVVSPGQCLTLALRVKFANGAIAEVSDAADGTFTAGGRGQFSAKNLWCPQASDAGRLVSLLGAYPGLPGRPPLAGKVAVTVRQR